MHAGAGQLGHELCGQRDCHGDLLLQGPPSFKTNGPQRLPGALTLAVPRVPLDAVFSHPGCAVPACWLGAPESVVATACCVSAALESQLWEPIKPANLV